MTLCTTTKMRHSVSSAIMLSCIMGVNAECRYAECHNAECRGTRKLEAADINTNCFCLFVLIFNFLLKTVLDKKKCFFSICLMPTFGYVTS
jgi:hypothetical protein